MQHLSEEQLNATLIGESDAEAAAHLATCAACRAEHDSLVRTLSGFHSFAESRAARPAGFWYAQRAAVAAQISDRSFTRPRLAVWVGAMAALTLAASMLAQSPQVGSAPQEIAVNGGYVVDHQFLLDVERSVQRTVPRALEPATALAQEMAQAYRDVQGSETQDAPENGSSK